MRRLSSMDVSFLNIESERVFAYVGSVAVLDPVTTPGRRLDRAALMSSVRERLHLAPPLRRRLVQAPLNLGSPVWVEDPAFDLEFHIRDAALPPPGGDEQLAALVAHVFGRPMDRTRPLWEVWLVHGLQDGRMALLTKIHHSLVDGVSGHEVVSVLLDETPEGAPVSGGAEDWSGGPLPSGVELLGRGLLGLARDTVHAVKIAPRVLPMLPAIPGAALVPGMPTLVRTWAKVRRAGPEQQDMLEVVTARAPRTPFSGPISAHRRWAFGSLPLEQLKRVKTSAGVTVNDALVTVCAGAIRTWLLQLGALPEDPLVAAIPLSVRSGEPGTDYGNQLGMMLVPIATNHPDPKVRMARTAAALRSGKEVNGALSTNLLTDVTNFLPPAFAAAAARTALGVLSRVRPAINVLISNVAGPRESLYCLGAEMRAYYPAPPIMPGMGLNITAVSYRDALDVGIMTDRDQVEDVWPLMNLLRSELDLLETALQR